MQSIGNKLEAARCKRGLSISEAAEATKIRGEFLSSFERDNFDFDLPEIYKSGFLRIYSQFLNINSERIITDFKACCLANTKKKTFSSRTSSYAFYGKTEVPLDELSPNDNVDSLVEKDEEETFSENNSTKEWLLKGSVLAVFLTISLVLFIFIYKWISHKDEPLADTNFEIREAEVFANTIEEINDRFYLIAKSGITVKVTDIETEEIIFDGFISAGEKKAITYSNRVNIYTNELENIIMEQDGDKFETEETGPGDIRFSPKK